MWWFLILSHYNFSILYLSDKLNKRVNTLLKRKQNMLKNISDERVQYCTMQMIWFEMLTKSVCVASVMMNDMLKTLVVWSQNIFDKTVDLKQTWVNAEVRDSTYKELCKII